MRKATEFPRHVYALRLNEKECELVKMIGDKYKCRSFSESIRFLILREADQLKIRPDLIESERKLTTW